MQKLGSVVGLFVLGLGLGACAAEGEEPESDPDTSLAQAVEGQTKLAPAKITATADDGNVPANTVDGKLATRWAAKGDGQSITYELAATATVKTVRIAFHKGNERTAKLDIQTSSDGKSWVTKKAVTSSGKTLALQSFDIAATSARFVRLLGHGNSKDAWNSLTEVDLWAEGTVTPPPPPPPGGDRPSDRLDLSAWKITLPLKGSGSSPLEVSDLEGYTSDPWFVVDPASTTGVRFRANAGGYTTSNSSYPRSELREMTTGGAKAAWSTTSGIHTMTIREAITALPKVKPHVVAGQIHDAEDDVVMIRLEQSRLFVEGGGEELALLDSAYQLGTIFTVALEATGGTIKVSYNGSQKLAYKRAATGCYFKAGVYTQSNPSKGESADAYGQVVIHALDVQHR